MDSTLIANENALTTWPLFAGCGPEMAPPDERLWKVFGRSQNLVERLRLLKGRRRRRSLQASENIRFRLVLQRLMRFMQAHRVDRWIISGGFSQIARPAAAK